MAFRRSMMLMTALLLVAAAARAQQPDMRVWQPDPDQDQPLQIDADRIAVSDARKVATFSGHVRLSQGDMHLRCSQARVWYRAVAPGNQSQIERVECQQ
jgi:lipopolysaccharide export system protein LptA